MTTIKYRVQVCTLRGKKPLLVLDVAEWLIALELYVHMRDRLELSKAASSPKVQIIKIEDGEPLCVREALLRKYPHKAIDLCNAPLSVWCYFKGVEA